jgi:hypothetical protein
MSQHTLSRDIEATVIPAGDVVTVCRRDKSAVRSLRASDISGRRPAHVPSTSSGVTVSVVAALIALRTYVTSSAVHVGVSIGPS